MSHAPVAARCCWSAEGWPRFTGDLAVPTMMTALPAGRRLRDLVRTGEVPVTTRGIRVSPYHYNLVYPTAGRVPDRPVYRPHDRDLGMVRAHYRGTGGPGLGYVSPGPIAFGETLIARSHPIPLPTVRTEFFSTGSGVKFTRSLDGTWAGFPVVATAPRAFRPGERVTETMYKGVMGPSFATPPSPYVDRPRPAWAVRQGDKIDVDIQTFSDTERGHHGAGEDVLGRTTGSVRLYRDGRLIGESKQPGTGVFTAPAAAGRYRLDVGATGNLPEWRVSKTVRSSWTFRSARDGRVTPLPLMAVRYVPVLDRFNRAPGGRVFAFPVRVEHQPGSSGGRVSSLVVQASLDDGRTWRPVRLRARDGQWIAELRNPARGHVSLQAVARDADGNRVKQTILCAYLTN